MPTVSFSPRKQMLCPSLCIQGLLSVCKHRKDDGLLVFFSFLETIIYLKCNLRLYISRDKQEVCIWRIRHLSRLYISAFQTGMCAQVSLVDRINTQRFEILQFYHFPT